MLAMAMLFATPILAAESYAFTARAAGATAYAKYVGDTPAKCYAYIKVVDSSGTRLCSKSSGPTSTTYLNPGTYYGDQPTHYKGVASGYTYITGAYKSLSSECYT